VLVREWLHDTAPPPRAPGAERGFRAMTRQTLAHARRMGGAPRGADATVASLEPDAQNTQDGRALASEDAVRGGSTGVRARLILGAEL
jgi:nuclear pore complex protein Nup107